MAEQTDQLDFYWEGIDKNRKKVNGVIPAKSEVVAKTELRRQGYRVTKIKKKSKPLLSAQSQSNHTGGYSGFFETISHHA